MLGFHCFLLVIRQIILGFLDRYLPIGRRSRGALAEQRDHCRRVDLVQLLIDKRDDYSLRLRTNCTPHWRVSERRRAKAGETLDDILQLWMDLSNPFHRLSLYTSMSEGSKATKTCSRGPTNRDPDKNQDLHWDWYDPIDFVGLASQETTLLVYICLLFLILCIVQPSTILRFLPPHFRRYTENKHRFSQ